MTSVRIEVESYHMGDFVIEEEVDIPPMVGGITDEQVQFRLSRALDRVVLRVREAYGIDKLERL